MPSLFGLSSRLTVASALIASYSSAIGVCSISFGKCSFAIWSAAAVETLRKRGSWPSSSSSSCLTRGLTSLLSSASSSSLGVLLLPFVTGVRRAFLGGEGEAGASADAVERVRFAAGIVDLSLLRGEEELCRW